MTHFQVTQMSINKLDFSKSISLFLNTRHQLKQQESYVFDFEGRQFVSKDLITHILYSPDLLKGKRILKAVYFEKTQNLPFVALTDAGTLFIDHTHIDRISNYKDTIRDRKPNLDLYVIDICIYRDRLYVLSRDGVVGYVSFEDLIQSKQPYSVLSLTSMYLLDTQKPVNGLYVFDDALLAFNKDCQNFVDCLVFASLDGDHWSSYQIDKIDRLVSRLYRHKHQSKTMITRFIQKIYGVVDNLEDRLNLVRDRLLAKIASETTNNKTVDDK